jgi:hypothetical protein
VCRTAPDGRLWVSVLASFNVEAFSLERSRPRFESFKLMSQIEAME